MKPSLRPSSSLPALRRSPILPERPATEPRAWRRWPVPALFGWLGCAVFWQLLVQLGWTTLSAWAAGVTLGCALALLLGERGASATRVMLMAGGFPAASALHLLAHQQIAGSLVVPAWIWLAPLFMLLMLYPLRAWRDAPLFPTETAALDQLSEVVRLPASARLLDAGCGLGHGLRALRRVWPGAQVDGIEWSAPIAWLAALRCAPARVRRGDMWQHSWAGYDLVYVFQRPETMARAVAKARAEMSPGGWLVSLEFEALDAMPCARLQTPSGKPVWIYRLPALKGRPVLVHGGRQGATGRQPQRPAAHKPGAPATNTTPGASSPELNKPI
jgi:hypothetical protein